MTEPQLNKKMNQGEQASKLASPFRALPSLGNWFVCALLSLANVLAVGLLTAAPLGTSAIEISLVAAFVAATVGSLLVAWIARAPAEIAVPAPSNTVIYAALGTDLMARSGGNAGLWEVWAAMSLAVVLMGLIVLLAGSLRLAGFIKFVPSPVIAGFVTGIGLLVIWSQLGPILGVSMRGATLDALWSKFLPGSVLVAAATVLALLLAPRFKRLGEPVLVALITGTLTYYLLSAIMEPAALGGTMNALHPQAVALQTTAALWGVVSPDWVASTALQVLPYAGLLALQTIMNAAMTAVTVGDLLGRRSDVNRTLVAQGCANLVCGALGALPVGTSALQSVAAARMKGNPRSTAVGSAAMLFILVMVAGQWLTWLPVAVLAAVLLMAGFGMVKQSTFRLIKTAWSAHSRNQSTIWTPGIAIIVAAAMFWGSVPLALMIGAVLAMVLLAMELSAATRFGAEASTPLGSRRAWAPEQAAWLREHSSKIAVFKPQGALFFGTADQLAQQLASTAPGTRFCVLDLSRLTTIDATACDFIAAGARALATSGVTPLLAGVPADSARGRNLLALGLSAPDHRTQWLVDLDRALEHAEVALLEEQWPGIATADRFEFGQTPLTLGLCDADLQELRACLRPITIAAGPLFCRGDAGASMYIIEAGQIEIRLAGAGPASDMRLAAFWPGSIFGELSMLMSQPRTADAVCVTSVCLLELDRRSLDALESSSPRLYGAVMRNLNMHIANRLDLATGLVRALQ
jgi:sulfate permease, SulP family